jgi:hypothetical protein
VKLIRVFPRRTSATPTDEDAYVGEPTLFAEADRINISVTFTYDLSEAERLAKLWKQIAPVEIGGPATGTRGGDFVPGTYLKKGYVITSRGCPNRCWFCGVWKREGENVRELPVTEGWNVLDDNLLACGDSHIKEVFAMLSKQKHRPLFTGGLEAARLKPWHVEELAKLKPEEMFFAYDEERDREPLYEAGRLLTGAGLKLCHPLRAYVLCGYPKDTVGKAEWRMRDCATAGFMPMAMVYRDARGGREREWIRFAHTWARPACARAELIKQGIIKG